MSTVERWIGIDFDQTLRRDDGSPIEAMVTRVRRWLADGRKIRIISARFAPDEFCTDGGVWLEANGGRGLENQVRYVQAWCRIHLGVRPPCQWGKSPGMIELWDDKVVRVEANTGRRLSASAVEDMMILDSLNSERR